jgi:hypothetical protein
MIWSNIDLVLWNFLGDERRGEREETGRRLREEDWKRGVAARVSQGPRSGGDKRRREWLALPWERPHALCVTSCRRGQTGYVREHLLAREKWPLGGLWLGRKRAMRRSWTFLRKFRILKGTKR